MFMTLQVLRKKKNLTADDMAQALGISRGHYSHLENGSRGFTDDLITKIAELLQVKRHFISEIAEKNRINTPYNQSWIFKIHIDGKPLLKAFDEYLQQERLNVSNYDIVNELAKFITYRIEFSIREELKNNAIIEYIVRRLNLK